MEPHQHHDHEHHDHGDHEMHHGGGFDLLLWGSISAVLILYLSGLLFSTQLSSVPWLRTLALSVFDLMNTIWWGIAIGLVMVAILGKVPREFIIAMLGRGRGASGILRATLGGVLLDLCSHGILLVGARLYERGASAGQVVAFLVASPWNSFSLTIVLIALIGFQWTMLFILFSVVIALITGLLFELLVARGRLLANPNRFDLPEDFEFWPEARRGMRGATFDLAFFRDMIRNGIMESRMVLRWILFGVVLAGLVKTFVDTSSLQAWFGPTLAGLGLTIVVATILEVCSEGSTPVAADLLTRAGAPGNSFAFLMTGVATDYTEIMILKETTKSWKFSLSLPLLTLPQVLIIGWLMNVFGST